MKKFLASLVLLAATASIAGAQSNTPMAQAAHTGAWEFGPIVQGGKGVTDQRDDFKSISAGVHVGKVLTPELLSNHAWRGNFEYAGEFYPFWQSYTPKFDRVKCLPAPAPVAFTCSGPYTVGGTFSGMTITPIILRWNFTRGHRIMPWFQGAGGILWTNHKYPAYPAANADVNLRNYGADANASVWNFTPQGGIGIHIFVKPKRSFDLGANAVHISSASLGDRNPGVNASVQFTAGYTWWK
ncbi:MAG: acyloxyacyl hydrolase [Acidobacteria bacterium]|nr:acyloxyacyl hydrolase [Acidobacteriota bacterium]